MKESNILEDFEQTFLGNCVGVGLSRRKSSDRHVCFTILHEDDDNWFASANPVSSFWAGELLIQLQTAARWMEDNCEPDPDGYGYRFKEKARRPVNARPKRR